MSNRKNIAVVSAAVAVFILMSAVFSFTCQALIVEKTKPFKPVSVSDCKSIDISMCTPPDMETHSGGGDVFVVSGNTIDRNFKTDIYLNTYYNENGVYGLYDSVIACGDVSMGVIHSIRCTVLQC